MQHQVEKLNAHEFVLLHCTFSIMKKILIPLYCITLSFLLFSCNDSEDLANKNFTEQFKDGFLESCSKQARLLMKKSEADAYCQCSLEQLLMRWDNDEEAGQALNGLPMLEVQRILVQPCVKK